MFGFIVDFTYVFADDAEGEKLAASKEKDGTNDGGKSLDRVAIYQCLAEDINHVDD